MPIAKLAMIIDSMKGASQRRMARDAVSTPLSSFPVVKRDALSEEKDPAKQDNVFLILYSSKIMCLRRTLPSKTVFQTMWFIMITSEIRWNKPRLCNM
jgi:hypothetical protein